jgi:hypothetical protein
MQQLLQRQSLQRPLRCDVLLSKEAVLERTKGLRGWAAQCCLILPPPGGGAGGIPAQYKVETAPR